MRADAGKVRARAALGRERECVSETGPGPSRLLPAPSVPPRAHTRLRALTVLLLYDVRSATAGAHPTARARA